MFGDLKAVNDLLEKTTKRLEREEASNSPDLRNLLYSMSSLVTIALGLATAIENIYESLIELERNHDDRLLTLSKKIVYLSALVSSSGVALLGIGRYLIGLVIK